MIQRIARLPIGAIYLAWMFIGWRRFDASAWGMLAAIPFSIGDYLYYTNHPKGSS